MKESFTIFGENLVWKQLLFSPKSCHNAAWYVEVYYTFYDSIYIAHFYQLSQL